jgi:MPBQ/MSBQ methyltransferase
MASGKGLSYDYSLRLYKEVFGLDHLHFGLWSESDPLTLDGFRSAQDRYAERLASKIPAGVRRILDVGCGTGSMSQRLLAAGFEVEPMSPCEHQEKLVKARLGSAVRFHRTRFQDFQPERPYDLVLMSESSQYVPLDQLFGAARRALAPRGSLLICDYFRHRDERFYRACHVLEPFLERSRAAGFQVEEMEDITERVLPTLQLGRQFYDRLGPPLLELGRDYFTRERRVLSWFASRLFAKRLAKLRRYVMEKLPAKLDHERFRREVTYRTYRFRID